jgi:hypothetical protein
MQEMMEEGGGLGTISEGLKTRTNEQIAKEVLGGFDLGQMAPWEVIRMAGEISELSTRVGVYSTQRMKDIARAGDDAAKLRTAGRSKEQIEKVLAGAEEISKERAALKAREATIDFSRAGQVTRILNSWIPLLNARVQGSVRNVEALASDPYGYMFRHALLTVIPQVATYRYAQEYFKDAWDEIPQAEKNANFIIPFGWYTTDAGERVPLRFKIPRDNVQQLLSIPLDYLLDTISNIEHDNQPLTVEQRNARGAWGTLKDELISQSPVDINPDELFDGHTFMQALGKGIGRAMPVIGIPGQLLSGTDWRTNRKLWDPADPYDPERPDTVSGPAIKWISEKLGLGETWGPAPSQLAFTIKSLGPGFQMFAGAGDMLVETLGAAPPKPLNYEAMVIPPDTDPAKADKVAADLSGRDLRPAWARYASFLIGSSGGAQTITAKASTADPKTALAQRETRDMNNAFNRWLNDPGEDGYLGKQRAIEKAAWDQRTHGEVISDFSDLEGSRKPYRLGLKDQYKNAITDARERRAFNASLPGIPVDVAWRDAALKEAAPSQIAQAAAEWNNPPQLGGRPDLMSNPQVLDRVHYDIVQKYAKEFGIEPKDLQDQIAAYNAGVRLPVLPLPAEYIEDALNIFFEPEIRDENNWEAGPVQVYKKKETDAEVFAAAQQASLAQFARHYGVPVGDLWERVAARLSFPEETSSPLKNSWNKAMSLAAEARNPANHPSFLDSAGNALGTWSDWTQFNATIEAHKGTDYKKLPINVRMLVDAKKRADLARVEFLQSDPDYDNYQRWFGVGRSLTEREWQEYQQGTTETGVPVRKYTVGDPADWTEFDKVLAQYSAMPQSDFRRQMMASRVKQIKKWMNPKWKSVLQQAEVDMNTDTAEEMDMLLGMAQE